MNTLKLIIDFHKIPMNQINQYLFKNETLNTLLEKLNFINVQLYNNIIEYNDSIENDQLLLSNNNNNSDCLTSVVIENLIKFYQFSHQLIHLYGRVNFVQQISEQFNLIKNFHDSKSFVHDHHRHHQLITSLLLNFLNEIDVLKRYWVYNENNDNVMIQTDQSTFQQFINYGQRILDLCQCNLNCFICEYIQVTV